MPVDEQGQWKMQFAQHKADGSGPVTCWQELFEVAKPMRGVFTELMQSIATEAGSGVEGRVGPLKLQARAEEKARQDYLGRGTESGLPWVWDVVRGMFLCDSCADLRKVINLVARNDSIPVIKFKNRFAKPEVSGFCDVNMQVSPGVGHDRLCLEFDSDDAASTSWHAPWVSST